MVLARDERALSFVRLFGQVDDSCVDRGPSRAGKHLSYCALVSKAFVDGLDPDDRAALQTLGTVRRFRRDAAVLLEGDEGDQVVVLREGRVRIVSTSRDGREMLIAVRGRGELVGELNALAAESAPRAATVIAMNDVTAQTIAAAEFLSFLQHRPRVALALLRQFADRLRESSNRHVDAGAYDTLHRVARALVELAEHGGRVVDDGVLVADGLTQEDLAGLVASSRETVARTLAALRSQGLIATGRRSIVIRDLDRLRLFTP
jgi:CRP-like cAMP-binding protein